MDIANGAKATNNFANTLFNRGFKASPDYTAYSTGSIGTGTNTPSASDTALQTPIAAWNGGSNYRTYETGYPSFDTSNLKVTGRTFVSSTQANSNTITEYGDFNTDGTPRIAGRFVFTGITKTNSIQIYFTPTYKITIP